MKKILIVGSIHLDIVGEFNESARNNIDKEGILRYSVGGAAYNIAANLSYKGHQVSVFSYLRKNSISAEAIKGALYRANINTKYVSEDPDLSESGYVSHSLSGDLVSAVSAMALQEKAFDQKELKQLAAAISAHHVVVLDTNLTPSQIEKVTETCKKYSRPAFVCSVSDSKCRRLKELNFDSDEGHFYLVSMNEKELAVLFEDVSAFTEDEICYKLNAKQVIITSGKGGFRVLSRGSGNGFDGSPAPVQEVKSELGAGDALLAAVVSYFVQHGTINWRDCEQIINDYVGRILKVEGATPEGLISSFKKSTKRENLQSSIALGSAFAAGVLTVGGFFLVQSALTYAALFLLIPLCSGISGAFIRHLLGKGAHISKNTLTNTALGGVAGLAVAITLFLSHWFTLASSIVEMISRSEVPDNMRPILGFLFLSAFVAGLAVEVAFDKTQKHANIEALMKS